MTKIKNLSISVAVIGLIFCSYFIEKNYTSQNQFNNFLELKKKTENRIYPVITYADLNQNGTQELYSLNKGLLRITENQKILWKSSKNWWVDSFSLADSNNDQFIELNLSVWKSDNFGSSKPFWVKENDPSVKNHFFVFTISESSAIPLWQSSNLENPNCQFRVGNFFNKDGNYLFVIEGQYSNDFSCKGQNLALWKWNGWGFSNEWRRPYFFLVDYSFFSYRILQQLDQFR